MNEPTHKCPRCGMVNTCWLAMVPDAPPQGHYCADCRYEWGKRVPVPEGQVTLFG